jgi:predicted enzyme related to lactoylglutathione lyase
MTNTTSQPVTWFEIATANPPDTRRFYGELFGWSFSDDEMAGSEYQMINVGADQVGGGLADTKGGQPNHAIFYVQVPDVADTCRRAEALGGKVVVPPTDPGGGLVFAQVQDGDGNLIGVWKPPA